VLLELDALLPSYSTQSHDDGKAMIKCDRVKNFDHISDDTVSSPVAAPNGYDEKS